VGEFWGPLIEEGPNFAGKIFEVAANQTHRFRMLWIAGHSSKEVGRHYLLASHAEGDPKRSKFCCPNYLLSGNSVIE